MANDSATGGFLRPIDPAPLEDVALAELLQALIVGAVGLPGTLVRPRWQLRPSPTPEPAVDWCAIGVMEEESEPNISTTHLAAGQGSSITYDVDMLLVRASFYGPNAFSNAKSLRTNIMIPQNRETLYNTGLALLAMPGKSQNASEEINNQYRIGADVELRFRRRTTLVWPILNILEMDGTLSSDREGGDLVDPLHTPSNLDPLKP